MAKKEKERLEKLEYLNKIVNEKIEFDERKEELVLDFIFNILASNVVSNRYCCTMYGNLEKGETIRLADCINYVGRKIRKEI